MNEKPKLPIQESLRGLLRNEDTLGAELKSNPDLINKQDEEGKTILHHAAALGNTVGGATLRIIFKALSEAEGANFTIQDNNGNTPVHTAAMRSDNRTTCDHILPYFVNAAAEHNFDFATLGQNGHTVLQFAAMSTYTNSLGKTIDNVQTVLQITGKKNINPGLDALSSTGHTALFYAKNHHNTQAANTLLEAGANPTALHSPGRHNPVSEIKPPTERKGPPQKLTTTAIDQSTAGKSVKKVTLPEWAITYEKMNSAVKKLIDGLGSDQKESNTTKLEAHKKIISERIKSLGTHDTPQAKDLSEKYRALVTTIEGAIKPPKKDQPPALSPSSKK